MVAIRVEMHDLDNQLVVPIMADAARRVRIAAQRIVPRRTGKLANSIQDRSDRQGSVPIGVVEAVSPYAIFVHNGTGIYGPRGREIVASKGRVFRFEAGGRTVYTRRIRGSRAQPFLVDALREVVG